MPIKDNLPFDWTLEQEGWLKENFKTHSNKELAVAIGCNSSQIRYKLRIMNLKKSLQDLAALRKRLPNAGKFESAKQWASKEPEVVIRTTKDGQQIPWVRLGLNMYMRLSHFNWVKAGRALVPKGYVLRHMDGDTMNCELDNLEKVTRKTHVRLNRIKAGLLEPGVIGRPRLSAEELLKRQEQKRLFMAEYQKEYRERKSAEREANKLAKKQAAMDRKKERQEERRQARIKAAEEKKSLRSAAKLEQRAARLEQRNAAIAKRKRDKEEAKRMLKAEQEERRIAEKAKAAGRKNRQAKEEKKFPTRVIDLTKLKRVQIDKKTSIFIRQDQDEAETIERYRNRSVA